MEESTNKSKLEWKLVKTEDNPPTYVKELFEPLVYSIGKLIKAEKKIFDKYKSQRK
jgi:hypothetical protein